MSVLPKLQKNKLIRNAIAYISGDTVQKAINFILVPIWVRYLTPEEYGIYGTIIAYAGMFTALLALGIPGAIVINYYDFVGDQQKLKAYVTSNLYFLICFSAAIILLLNLFGEGLWATVTSGNIPFDPFVRLALILIIANLSIHTISSVYQADQRPKSFLLIQYAKFGIVIVFTAVLVIGYSWGAVGMLTAQALGGLIVAVIALYIFAKNWFVTPLNSADVVAGLKLGLPLLPHVASLWILQSSDRLILENYVSLEALGIYNLGYTLGLVLMYVVQGVNKAWAPYSYRLMKTGRDPQNRIAQFAALYFGSISIFCVLGIVFANELIHILFPIEYFSATVIVIPVLFGAFMSSLYLFVVKPIMFLKKTVLVPMISLSVAVANIILNLAFIPIFGAIAAAWTTAFAYFLMFVFFYIMSQKHYPVHYPTTRYLFFILLVFSGTLLMSSNYMLQLSVEVITLKMILVVTYFYLVYRFLFKGNDEINQLTNKKLVKNV